MNSEVFKFAYKAFKPIKTTIQQKKIFYKINFIFSLRRIT